MNITRNHAASTVAALSICTLIANAGLPTHSWLNAVDGNWNIDANWDAGTVPNMGSDVQLGLVGPYTVSSVVSIDAGTLTISNPDARLHIDTARTLNLFGDLVNDGAVVVNPFNGGSATQLDFESNTTISGSGELRLAGTSTRARVRSGAGVSVTQAAGHSMTGFGVIESALNNNGLVNADVSGQVLGLSFFDKTNNAIIRASGGGQITLTSITLTQGASGILEAVGAGSGVELSSATIIGGEVRADADGLITSISGTFDGVDFSGGSLHIPTARTLDVFNSITNDGVITINPTNGGSSTQLDFESDGSFLGSGEVVLAGNASRARLRTGAGFTMTNSSNHTIRGFGQIESMLVNDGLVSADVAGQQLTLNFNDKVNNATMQGVFGGILELVGVSVDQTGGGELIADGVGSELRLTNGTVIGGTISSRNGASSSVTTATLHGVIHEGLLNIPASRTIDVIDSITNNGVIMVNPTNGGSVTQIDFENDGSLLGNGEIVLGGVGSRARVRTGTDITMTNSSTHTIRGFGTIEAAMINDGLVQADADSLELGLVFNDKVNNATMQAINGGIIDFSPITVQQSASGEIIADGAGSRVDFNSTTIVGGTIETLNGGSVQVVSATYDAVTSNADTALPTGRTLDVLNNTANNGTIQVNPANGGSVTSIRWADDSEIGGVGTISLLGFSSRARLNLLGSATVATLGQGQRLEGIGSIDAPLIHHGTTAPGMSIGTLLATESITYSDTSVFEAEVDSTTSDLLDNTKSITIDGTLQVIYVDGFAPTGYWARKIMEGSSITGKFTTLLVPDPAPGFVTRVYNDGSNLFVGQTCPSDTNLDGALNFFDVSVFLSNYNAGNFDADLNGDGSLNFFDVSTFLSSYNAGC